jgi:hypothetical protein
MASAFLPTVFHDLYHLSQANIQDIMISNPFAFTIHGGYQFMPNKFYSLYRTVT